MTIHLPSIDVALDLTRVCNNRCLYCFASAEDQPGIADVRIGYEDACRLLRIVQTEFDINAVRFTGGEATLHPRLVDLVHFVRLELAVPKAVLLTNGRRLRDADFCQALYYAGLTSMQISLESSNPEIHDRLVGIRGAWAETVEGIKNALRLYPSHGRDRGGISLKITLSALNSASVEETLRFAAGQGICSVTMNVCTPSGRGSRQAALVPRIRERMQILAKAQALARALKLEFLVHASFDLCVEDPQSLNLRHYHCGRGRHFVALDAEGHLHLCEVWGRRGDNLLKSNSVRAIWAMDDFRYFWYGRQLPDRCRLCERLYLCGGVCPALVTASCYGHIYDADSSHP